MRAVTVAALPGFGEQAVTVAALPGFGEQAVAVAEPPGFGEQVAAVAGLLQFGEQMELTVFCKQMPVVAERPLFCEQPLAHAAEASSHPTLRPVNEDSRSPGTGCVSPKRTLHRAFGRPSSVVGKGWRSKRGVASTTTCLRAAPAPWKRRR